MKMEEAGLTLLRRAKVKILNWQVPQIRGEPAMLNTLVEPAIVEPAIEEPAIVESAIGEPARISFEGNQGEVMIIKLNLS